MNRSIIVAALAVLSGAPLCVHAAAPSAAECERSASLTHVQRQVVDKAAQGIRPLVLYIHRTRMIHQLDVMETIAWLDERRELRRACGERVGQLAPSGG